MLIQFEYFIECTSFAEMHLRKARTLKLSNLQNFTILYLFICKSLVERFQIYIIAINMHVYKSFEDSHFYKL